MICNRCCRTGRLGCLRTCRKLFCRITVIIGVGILIVWILCLINLRYIPGIIHGSDREILIACIELGKADIHGSVCNICKLISVHIDNLYTGVIIGCLDSEKSVRYCRIQRGLTCIKALNGTASLITLIIGIGNKHIHSAVLGNFKEHILCYIVIAAILSDLCFHGLYGKIPGIKNILDLKSDLCGCSA